MKQCSILLLLTSLLVQLAAAQAPDTVWTRLYDCSSLDAGRSVQITADGGFVIAGYCKSSLYRDFLVLRIDDQGNEVWTSQIGEVDAQEEANAIRTTRDGGFIAAGETTHNAEGIYDFWLVKMDSTGAVEWDSRLGTDEGDHATDVRQTPDGGYILVGYRHNSVYDNDVVLIKTDDQGNEEWTTIIQTIHNETGESIVLDGNDYVIGGWRVPAGDSTSNCSAYWVDNSGTVTSQQDFGGGSGDYGCSVCRGNGGEVLVGGYSYSFGGGLQGFVGSVSKSGSVSWSLPVGGSYDDSFYHVQGVLYDGYIAVGSTESSPGNSDAWIVKISDTGNLEWENSFDIGYTDYIYSATQTPDGGYAMCGATDAGGDYDVLLVRIEPPTGMDSGDQEPSSMPVITVSDNPAWGKANLIVTVSEECMAELRIFDTAGRLIDMPYSGVLTSGSSSISTGELPSGLYVARLFDGTRYTDARFTIIR